MNTFDVKPIPGKGQGLVARKDFCTDDVIFEEEPFVSCQFSWNADYGYAACNHCLRPLETIVENVRRLANDQLIVVPFLDKDPTMQWIKQFTNCPRCNVRYCSEECRREALQRYHRTECMGASRTDKAHPLNILNETWKQLHYPPESGSILLIARLMAMYHQSSNRAKFLQTLEEFQSLTVNADQQIYHKMLGANFEHQLEALYSAFCNAHSGDEFVAFTTPDAFRALMGIIGTNSQGIATSVLAEWVKNVSSLALPDSDKADLDKYITELYEKVENFAGEFLNNEGSGLYALQSKINHSCTPNAQSTFPYSNDIVVLKVIAPIKAGEEICISYLDECQLERSRHSRQRILKENYIFECECPKCKEQENDPDITSEEEDDMETDDCDDMEL